MKRVLSGVEGSGVEGRSPGAALAAWYAVHGRDLPFRAAGRDGRDPYRTWLFEVLAQQTQLSRAIGAFERFVAAFPDVAALAAADETEVLRLWEGLGYYARARQLHAAARQVAAAGGGLPTTAAGWRALPGVGPYTAAAVASLCFGEAAPAVDANARRVIARVLALDAPPSSPAFTAVCEKTLGAWLAGGDPGAINEAVMELGEEVCRKAAPACAACPLAPWCAAHAAGRETDFPISRKQAVTIGQDWAVLVLRDAAGRTLAVRDSGTALWPGLWLLPYVVVPASPVAGDRKLEKHFAKALGADLRIEYVLAPVRHGYTNHRLRLFPCLARSLSEVEGGATRGVHSGLWQEAAWLDPEGLAATPFPSAFRKVLGAAR